MTAEPLDAMLVFATTYRVMRTDRLLAEAGVAHGLAPVPTGVRSSCGLSLRIPLAALPRALQVAAEAGVPADAAYRSDGAGWVAIAASKG